MKQAFRKFSKSAVSLLLLKRNEGNRLTHVSGVEAVIDDDGYITTPVGSFKGSSELGLAFFIIAHGDLVDYSSFVTRCRNDLETLPDYDSCKTEMENDVRVSKHLDKVVSVLGRGANHDAEFFIGHFLDILLSHSKGIRWDEKAFDEVYEDFEHFFYSDYVQYTAFAAIWGFHKWPEIDTSETKTGLMKHGAVISRRRTEPEDPIQLTKRVRILPTMKSSIHEYSYTQGGFLPPTGGNWDFPYILEFSGSARKKFKVSKKRRVVPAHQLIHSEISRVIGAARLFKKGDIQFAVLGHITHDWFRKLGRFGLPSPQRITSYLTYDINSKEEKELRKFCNWFAGIRGNESLELAMDRFNLSYERKRFKDSLIDQIVAFEALLIQIDDNYIRRTLSRRTANLIGESDMERQSVYDDMYEAYYIRSKIVHGDRKDEIASILKSKDKQLVWYVYDIQELLRRTIRKFAHLVKEGQSKTDIISNHDMKVPGRPKRRIL